MLILCNVVAAMDWMLTMFIGGLQNDLQSELVLVDPQMYYEAVSKAKQHEKKKEQVEQILKPSGSL